MMPTRMVPTTARAKGNSTATSSPTAAAGTARRKTVLVPGEQTVRTSRTGARPQAVKNGTLASPVASKQSTQKQALIASGVERAGGKPVTRSTQGSQQASTPASRPQKPPILPSDREAPDRCASVLGELHNLSKCNTDTVAWTKKILGTAEGVRDEYDSKAAGKFTSKQIHFAKQIINASIQTIGDLATTNWRPTAYASSSSSNGFVSEGKGPATHASVVANLQCFQIAAQFLATAAKNDEKRTVKLDELIAIVIGLARRAINLELYFPASGQLSWLLSLISDSTDSTLQAGTPYCLPLPLKASTTVLLQLLDVQSLLLTAHLAGTASIDEIHTHLDQVLQNPCGPYAWQKYVRSQQNLSDNDYQAADRALYVVERAVMRLSPSQASTNGTKTQDQVLPASPRTILKCRALSLHLLLLASNVDFEAFWDRALRVGASFIRTSLAACDAPSQQARQNAFEPVHELFRDLDMRVGQLPNTSTHRQPYTKAFKTFCEAWIGMARRAGDSHAVRFISSLRDDRAVDAGTASSDPDGLNSLPAERTAERATSIFALASMSLQKMMERDNEDELSVLRDAAHMTQSLSKIWQALPITGKRTCVDEMETVRRQCMTAFDKMEIGAQNKPENNACSIFNLLEALAQAYEEILFSQQVNLSLEEQNLDCKLYQACVQARRVLAKGAARKAADPSQEKVYILLQAAHRIADHAAAQEWGVSMLAQSETLRHLASSWHNCGACIYGEKRPESAVRFLRRAAECTERSVKLYEEMSCENTDDDTRQAQGTQVETLSKKWEHLAICCRFADMKRDAREYYIKALLAIPNRVWNSISARAASLPISQVFLEAGTSDSQRSVCDTATLIKALFDLEAYELFVFAQDKDTGEPDLFQRLSGMQEGLTPDVICAAREHCLLSMRHVMHREGAARIAMTLIEAQLEDLDSSRFPLRRVSTLLMKMEMFILMPKLDTADTVRTVQNEALAILSRDCRKSEDIKLSAHQAQLGANLSVLSALLSQVQPQHVTTERFPENIDNLVEILQSLEEREGKKQLAMAKTGRPVLRKTLIARQEKQHYPPKTPQRQSHSFSSAKLGKKTIQASDEKNDSVEEEGSGVISWALLELVCLSVAAYGDAQRSHRLWHIAAQLARSCVSSEAKNFRLKAFASLVHGYIYFERKKRATAVAEELKELIHEFTVDVLQSEIGCFANLAVASCYSFCGSDAECQQIVTETQRRLGEMDLKARPNTWHNVFQRCQRMQLQATCASLQAICHLSSGDFVAAINSSVASVRFALKAGSALVHLCGSRTASNSDDPFTQSAEPRPLPIVDPSKTVLVMASLKKTDFQYSSVQLACLSRQIFLTTMSAYSQASRLHARRGSARDAEGLATEAVNFSSKTQFNLSTISLLYERASLRLEMGLLGLASEDISLAKDLKGDENQASLDIARQMLNGDCAAREGEHDKALCYYEAGLTMIARMCETTDLHAFAAPANSSQKALRKGVRQSISEEDVLPALRGKVRQKIARLLHQKGDTEDALHLLNEAVTSCSPSAEAYVQSSFLISEQGWNSLKKDPLLGVVAESVYSQPKALQILTHGSEPRHRGAVLGALQTTSATTAFTKALTLLRNVLNPSEAGRTDSVTLRTAFVQTAMSLISHSASEQQTTDKGSTEEVIKALDASMSVTLDRELLESVQAKIDRENMQKGQTGGELRYTDSPTRKNHRSADLLCAEADDSDGELERAYKTEEYESLRRWMEARRLRLTIQSQAGPTLLPADSVVISITLCHERNSLVLTRREGPCSSGSVPCVPQILTLPIDRRDRRDGEEEGMTADRVLMDLKSIIDDSNFATHNTQQLDNMDARKRWWSHRRALDMRLKELLESIEASWLGAFKGLLAPRRHIASELRAALKQAITLIVSNASGSSSALKRVASVDIKDTLVDCLVGLQATSYSDEDLEDFIHFALDTCQAQGHPIAIDEVDMDQCTTDLRAALDSCSAKHHSPRTKLTQDATTTHIYLILDKDLQAIPWESLPCLRGQAICRVPSVTFLQDRLAMMQDGTFCIPASTSRKWYLLNPSVDLTRTQERFSPYLQDANPSSHSSTPSKLFATKQRKHHAPWRGIIGRAPTLDEFADALETNDLVLYFGHGGAEQYIRPSRMRSMQRCAVTMLWGCSSGVLRDMGDYERTGTPYNYMLAGCPSLVANLWDATDKELDGVSESVLRLMGIIDSSMTPTPSARDAKGGSSSSPERNGVRESKARTAVPPKRAVGSKPMSIAEAVAKSRDACKLPYLTGAACVVYGIPVYFIDGA